MNKAEFIEVLKKHDWHYEMSDDHREWKRGSESIRAIRGIASQSEELADLFLRYQSAVVNRTEKPTE